MDCFGCRRIIVDLVTAVPSLAVVDSAPGIVSVRAACRTYGSGRRANEALRDCNIDLYRGEIVGLVGPNGAGKTTLLKLIAGHLNCSSGSIMVAGHRAGTREARRMIGFAADPPVAPRELSGLEWLGYLASHRSENPAVRVAKVRKALEMGDLSSFARRRIAEYSRGMSQQLALSAAALCGDVLLLDETLSGLDPIVAKTLRKPIAELAASGRVVLISTHDLAAVERIATRAVILVEGRVAASVRMAELLSSRVAEIGINNVTESSRNLLVKRFPAATLTPEGISVPLTGGLTVEGVLVACRTEHLAVSDSKVRYAALEDLFVKAVEGSTNSPG